MDLDPTPDPTPSPEAEELARAERRFRTWLGIVVIGGIVAVVGTVILNATSDGSTPSSTTGAQSQLLTCPDFLEVAGPYRQGIDVEYDPRMDWDGDGVSCES